MGGSAGGGGGGVKRMTEKESDYEEIGPASAASNGSKNGVDLIPTSVPAAVTPPAKVCRLKHFFIPLCAFFLLNGNHSVCLNGKFYSVPEKGL